MAGADFSYHSSPSTSEDAVDSIISQAMDQIALEQIAKLNTSHLSDSVLPTTLESRFRKLKSLPPPPPPTSSPNQRTPPKREEHEKENVPSFPGSPPAAGAEESRGFSSKTQDGFVSSLANQEQLRNEKVSNLPNPSPPSSKPQERFLPSPLDRSPTRRQACCFGFSPKSKKKSWKGKGKGLKIGDGGEWLEDDDLISSKDTLHIVKEQRRRIEKALVEREKVRREAEKLVELVKQASARLDFSAIDELLSEDEKFMD